MQRYGALKRGRVASILLAGGIGYFLGSWHAATSANPDLSAAQSIALRFPSALDSAAPAYDASMSAAAATGTANTASATALGDMQALLSPQPMIPQLARQSEPQATAPADAPEAVAPPPTEVARPPVAAPIPRPAAVAPHPAAAEAKPAAPGRRRPERQGFVLNDAQIASIKHRLHLTPDQERMWPAVEAALRNIAYASLRDSHRRGLQPGARSVASVDPNGSEVQDLKYAAFPLIMSFSPEQKSEVRSLAHVMGLDRLASEF